MALVTPKARISFPRLFSKDDNGVYSVQLIFEKTDDLTALKEAASKAKAERWGDNPPKGLRSPFRNGDEKERPELAGKIFINIKTKNKPGVVGPSKQQLDEDDVYGGCYGRASVSCYAYDKDGNRGVAFGLNNFQKLGDGDRFGGGSSADDDFDAVEDDSDVNDWDEPDL